MSVFRHFEEAVIDSLTEGVLPSSVIAALKQEGEVVDFHTTGHGYFLTVKHASLPVERIVCDGRKITGTSDGVRTGFVIFLERRELTLECYGLPGDVPDEYRNQNVAITAT